MHCANSNICEVVGPEGEELPTDPDDVAVVVGLDEPDDGELDECDADEPDTPELAWGDPLPHAASPKVSATMTAASAVARHARPLLIDVQFSACSVSSVFMSLPFIPSLSPRRWLSRQLYENQSDSKVTAVTLLSPRACHPWHRVVRRDRCPLAGRDA
jgi:hypothetical protein